MRSVSILSVAGLAALVAAQPMEKRDMDVEWVTVTQVEEVYTTVDVTSTKYIDGPVPTPPAPSHSPQEPEPKPHHHPEPKPHSHPAPEHQHHHHHNAHHKAHSPSPPPAPTTTAAPAPTTQAAPPPAPTTTAAPSPVAPSSKAPAPKPSPSPQPSYGGVPADAYSGDMTHYAPGLGSCGFTSTKVDNIVALAVDMMNNPANPNDNPLCGKTITIDYAGQQHIAKIVDTCWGCSMEDIDLSPKLFQAVAPDGDGRVYNVKWWMNN